MAGRRGSQKTGVASWRKTLGEAVGGTRARQELKGGKQTRGRVRKRESRGRNPIQEGRPKGYQTTRRPRARQERAAIGAQRKE